MRNKPTYTYNGLTIVLSQGSRFDKTSLLTGTAGYFFNNDCLGHYTNRWCSDIRTSDTAADGLLPNTKGILLLGERAFHEWLPAYKTYSLGEQRGNRLQSVNGLPTICSFLPQDAIDMVDWESKLNEQLIGQDVDDESVDEEYEDVKKHGKTARSNYRFWLARDTKKICALLFPDRVKPHSIESIYLQFKDHSEESPRIYANSSEIIQILSTTKNQNFYVDIETDSLLQMSCFGFAFDTGPVYVVPICRYTYDRGYSSIGNILRALAIALRDNTVVIHNTLFDLWVLAQKYRIPCGKNIYDTMLSQHRIFAEVEKSLGHCISLWLWEEFHKDEGIFEPQNRDQETKLWEYNAKDVARMRLIHRAQMMYANARPGLKDSIELGNRLIRPYLINTMMGMRYDQDRLAAVMLENDRKMTQYLRWLKYLVGPENVDKIKGKSKAGLLSSNVQCCRYFHDMMGYPILKRTKENKPSIDADTVYRLKLKHNNNPVLDILLKYRELQKETGSLKFNPWINSEGKKWQNEENMYG